LLFPQLNHIEKWRKYVFGSLCLIVFFVALFWNLLVGHYRTALAVDADNAESLAIQSFLESLFYLGGLASWMLSIIGFLIFIFVCYKAYHQDDPYPGYSKIDRRLNDAKLYKAELILEWRDFMEELYNKYVQTVDDKYYVCEQRADRLERSHRSIKQQISILDRYVDSYNQVFESCIRTYRQVNKQNRTTPYPNYFDSFMPANFSHNFHPEAVLDKRQEIKEKRDEIRAKLPEIKNQLLNIFKNMVERLD
jgi:hypothetical protein